MRCPNCGNSNAVPETQEVMTATGVVEILLGVSCDICGMIPACQGCGAFTDYEPHCDRCSYIGGLVGGGRS